VIVDWGLDADKSASHQAAAQLLAALSQASFIHVREGRRKVPPGAFNEAYMMHATTSPLYASLRRTTLRRR
jgi:arginine/lysine/ornithine decarboxylase